MSIYNLFTEKTNDYYNYEDPESNIDEDDAILEQENILTDDFDDNNLLDGYIINTYIKYKFDISTVKDYMVIGNKLYILNSPLKNIKFINKIYTLYVINLPDLTINNVIDFKDCLDGIIYDKLLLIYNSNDKINSYNLETQRYFGTYSLNINKINDSKLSMIIIKDNLFICYFATDIEFIIYDPQVVKNYSTTAIKTEDTFVLNDDDYNIYLFDLRNKYTINIVTNTSYHEEFKLTKTTKISNNIYSINFKYYNVIGNKEYEDVHELIIANYKIGNNLYLYEENIYLFI